MGIMHDAFKGVPLWHTESERPDTGTEYSPAKDPTAVVAGIDANNKAVYLAPRQYAVSTAHYNSFRGCWNRYVETVNAGDPITAEGWPAGTVALKSTGWRESGNTTREATWLPGLRAGTKAEASALLLSYTGWQQVTFTVAKRSKRFAPSVIRVTMDGRVFEVAAFSKGTGDELPCGGIVADVARSGSHSFYKAREITLIIPATAEAKVFVYDRDEEPFDEGDITRCLFGDDAPEPAKDESPMAAALRKAGLV